MALPDFSLRQLLEAGVHFGHQTHRWNPHMGPFIYGARNGIHIIDLTQTVPMLVPGAAAGAATRSPRAAASSSSAPSGRRRGGRRRGPALGAVLREPPLARRHADQLEDHLAARSRGCAIDEKLADGAQGLTKKERLALEREQDKLEQSLGGIRDMGGTPDMIFVIDTNKEASRSSRRSSSASRWPRCSTPTPIPTASAIRSRATTTPARAIALYCDLIARAALDGMSRSRAPRASISARSEEAPVEPALEDEIGAGARSRAA